MIKKNVSHLLVFIPLLVISISFLEAQVKPSDNKSTEINILFIGNSLTYSNNLPKQVRYIAKEAGISIKTDMIAIANYALIDHLNDGEIQKKITTKKFDFVVIQQGPSSQEEGKKLLLEASTKISALCQKQNSKMVLFMVWPSLEYYQTFDDVINNYREVAKINNAILCPVGEAWKTHFNKTNNFDYYGPDGFHPSSKGSQIAAKIIVESLFK